MKISAIARWVLALICLGFCIKCMAMALKIEGLGAVGLLILSFAGLLNFLLLISPETTLRVCEFFSRIFTSIILPDDKFQRPRLSYILARRYRTQLRYQEAVEEYQKIIQYYPDEQAAYRELIAMAAENHDERLTWRYVRAFESRFGNAKSIPVLGNREG